MAVTFEPHPFAHSAPRLRTEALTPVPEKLRLLETTGIDAVLVLPFGRDLSLMTPRQFAERILKITCTPARCMKAITSALATKLRAT